MRQIRRSVSGFAETRLLPPCNLYFSAEERASPRTGDDRFSGGYGSSHCWRASRTPLEQIVELARASPRRGQAKPSANSIEMHSALALIKHGAGLLSRFSLSSRPPALLARCRHSAWAMRTRSVSTEHGDEDSIHKSRDKNFLKRSLVHSTPSLLSGFCRQSGFCSKRNYLARRNFTPLLSLSLFLLDFFIPYFLCHSVRWSIFFFFFIFLHWKKKNICKIKRAYIHWVLRTYLFQSKFCVLLE